MHLSDYANCTKAQGAISGLSGAEVGYGAQCSEQRRQEPTVTAFVEVRADRLFADALMAAMDGQRITRRGWNAANQYVSAQYPDKGSKMSAPYLFLKNAQNEMVPWVPSQGDLFAHDWAILPR
jgi:hypothetical protein